MVTNTCIQVQSNKGLITYLHAYIKSVTYLCYNGHFPSEPVFAGPSDISTLEIIFKAIIQFRID